MVTHIIHCRSLNRKRIAFYNDFRHNTRETMWQDKYKKLKSLLMLGLLLVVSSSGGVTALQSSSASYGIDESFFGNGGELNACSSSYCTRQTAGDLGVGNSSSSSYQIQAGSNVTDREPFLEMVVNNPNTDIGTLTTTTTKTATATFHVKTYLAGGYIVQTSSPGPQNNGYTMQGLSSPAGSSIGNEQFGINLVANSCPGAAPSSGPGSCSGGLGANVAQNPDATFGFGFAATGYDTANQYKYVNGDTIAKSNTSSGESDFTISYIYNISNLTPGGTYILQQNLVATSTY